MPPTPQAKMSLPPRNRRRRISGRVSIDKLRQLVRDEPVLFWCLLQGLSTMVSTDVESEKHHPIHSPVSSEEDVSGVGGASRRLIER